MRHILIMYYVFYEINYLKYVRILMEMVLEGSISQTMATLLKLLPIDMIKHFCTYYSYYSRVLFIIIQQYFIDLKKKAFRYKILSGNPLKELL